MTSATSQSQAQFSFLLLRFKMAAMADSEPLTDRTDVSEILDLESMPTSGPSHTSMKGAVAAARAAVRWSRLPPMLTVQTAERVPAPPTTRSWAAVSRTCLFLVILYSMPAVLATGVISLPATVFVFRRLWFPPIAISASYAILFRRLFSYNAATGTSVPAGKHHMRIFALAWHSLIYFWLTPVIVLQVMPSCRAEQPASECNIVAVYEITLIVHVINALTALLTFPRLGILPAVQSARVHLAVGFLFCQLRFSIFFGGQFEQSSTAVRILLCSLYPFCIQAFKLAMAVLVQRLTPLSSTLNGLSIVFAALPYRLLFFAVRSWTVFVLIMVVEVTYKVLTYMIPLSLSFLRWQRTLRRQLRPLLSMCLAAFRPMRVSPAGKGEPKVGDSLTSLDPPLNENELVAQAGAQLSKKFFVHHLADLTALLNIGTGLLLTRVMGVSQSLSRAIEDDYITTLAVQYSIMALLELFLIFVGRVAIKGWMGRRYFQPFKYGLDAFLPTLLEYFGFTLVVVLVVYGALA
eukprot:PLAT9115.2.p1 GENE.PLAT9115.2~~PLAT9115.2.p1  ORF type:complete len:520 (+),score=129.61 PLAT9115.2:504-2063(+)